MSAKRLYTFIVSVFLLAVSIPLFGSKAKRQHPAPAHQLSQRRALTQPQRLQQRSVQAPKPRARSLSLSPKPKLTAPGTSRVGLLAATQMPMGYQDGTGYALAGDFNGDGKKDVLTEVYDAAVTGNYMLETMLGNGDGTFQAPRTTVVTNYGDVHVGDMNLDGRDDVIVTNGGNLDIYLSNGDGTFGTPMSFATGASAVAALAITDLNGDHVPDLMIIDNNSEVITALGNDDGTFQAPTSVPYSGNADSAVIADLNGDGKLDFAAIESGAVTVYLNDGSGSYQGPTYLDSNLPSNYAYHLVAGDLNGDGKPDLVASDEDYVVNNVAIFLNSGNGTFSNGVSQWAGFLTAGLAIADVNGDGKSDIVAANTSGSDITVLLGNGDGTVQSPLVGYAVGGYPWSNPVVADFNADGKPDVIIPDNEFNLVYLQGYGDGSFRAAQDYFSPLPISDTNWPWSESVAAGDFNGDGAPDIVGGNCCNSEVGVTVFLGKGDGSGSLQPGVNYGGNGLDYVAVADFDGDGRLDIAAASNTDGLIHILQGNGDGTFQSEVTYGSGSYYPYGIIAADLNGDGKADLAVVDDYYGVAVFLNDGQGGFLPEVEYSLPGWSDDIAVADVNGDGKVDLLVPDYDNGTVDVLAGNGDGTFQDAQSYDAGGYPYSIAVGDANGDGTPDVFTANYDDGISVLLGNGDGTFQPAATYLATLHDTSNYSPQTVWIRTADIDGDGSLDLVATNENYGSVSILYGNGDGSFSDPAEFPTGGYPWWLTTVDMNGDGAPDVITADYDQIGTTVLLNAGGNRLQLAAAPNPSQYGGTITLTATVTPTVRGVTASPTGTVTFFQAPNTLGSATVAGGSATQDIASPPPGNYDMTASYSGDGAFRPNSASSSLSVNKATTTTTVTSSANPSTLNQTVTFTAAVVSGTSGTPTGTVTFSDNGTPLAGGTVALTSGSAALSTAVLTAGTHNITALYSGDTNYAGSTSAVLSQVVSAAAPNYTLGANQTSATITSGRSATFQITATADEYFNGTVSLSCGQLPVGVSCTFTPASMAPTNGHPATTSLVITTTSMQAALATPLSPASRGRGAMFLASLGGFGLFGGLLMGDFSRRRCLAIAAIVIALALVVLGMSGCGSSSSANPNGTPTGQYSIQVVGIATAGTTGGNTTAHNLTLALNVTK